MLRRHAKKAWRLGVHLVEAAQARWLPLVAVPVRPQRPAPVPRPPGGRHCRQRCLSRTECRGGRSRRALLQRLATCSQPNPMGLYCRPTGRPALMGGTGSGRRRPSYRWGTRGERLAGRLAPQAVHSLPDCHGIHTQRYQEAGPGFLVQGRDREQQMLRVDPL